MNFTLHFLMNMDHGTDEQHTPGLLMLKHEIANVFFVF